MIGARELNQEKAHNFTCKNRWCDFCRNLGSSWNLGKKSIIFGVKILVLNCIVITLLDLGHFLSLDSIDKKLDS